MNQVLHLFQLQNIDTQLDLIARKLTEIDAILSGDHSVQNAEKSLAEVKQRLITARHNLNLAEDLVNVQRIKIETNESALYSGKIKNPKELSDLQADIASLKKYLVVLEDQLLETMLQVDSIEMDHNAAEKKLIEDQSIFTIRQSGLLGDKNQSEQLKMRLLLERQASLSQVNTESFNIYEKLRGQKRGLAVSVIEEGTCKACGSSLRPDELQLAHSPDKIIFCSSCGRIVYVG